MPIEPKLVMVFGGQVVQKVEPDMLYMPFGQLTQTLCPYPVLYVPVAQNKHILDGILLVSLPGLHAMHEVDDASGA
jgi:hypothetical protein